MTKKKTKFVFEKALENLNDIVEKMEQGGLSLEDSLKQFEEGVKLTKECQKALSTAEQKVKVLMEKHGQAELTDFDFDDDEN